MAKKLAVGCVVRSYDFVVVLAAAPDMSTPGSLQALYGIQTAATLAYEKALAAWEKDGSRCPVLGSMRLTDRAWEAEKKLYPLWTAYREALSNLKAIDEVISVARKELIPYNTMRHV